MNNQPNQSQNIEKKNNTELKDTQNTKPLQTSESEGITEGLNLMPSMSEEEKVVEKTKSTVSIGSAVSLIILVAVILLVVGFNIISRQILNAKKDNLYTIENRINQQSDKILANEEIVDRAVLYTNIKRGAFSHKDIIEFLNRVGTKAGDIQMRSVMISEKLDFTYTGYTSSLEQVSKLWYILGSDENIDNINLQAVGKGDNRVTFTFEGTLSGKNFFNQ